MTTRNLSIVSPAASFLEQLRPGGPWVLIAIKPDGPTAAITATTFGDIDRFVSHWNGERNIYYSLNPTVEAVTKKPSKGQIYKAEYAHADLDPRDDETPATAKQRYLSQLANHQTPPTFIIDSGNGIQPLWRLDVPIEPGQFDAVEAVSLGLTLSLGGTKGTQNVDRILRLPGTRNLPNRKKLAAGRVECDTALIEYNEVSYPLSRFKFETKVKAADIQTEGLSADMPDDLVKLLEMTDSGEYPSRSELAFAFMTNCLRAGVAPQTIREACIDTDYSGKAIFEHCKENAGDDYVKRQINKAYKKVNERIDSINADHALVLSGNKAAIMKFEGDRTKFRLLQISAFKTWFANHPPVKVGDDFVPVSNYWIGHRLRRQYEGIEFIPGGDGTPGYYNLWRGFAAEPRNGDCSKFLAHMKDNVAKGDEATFKWIMGWWAQIFQQPAVKMGTSLVLRGPQGVGKSKIGEVMGALLGSHYMSVSSARYITGQFNAHMISLLLLHADEAFWAGDKQSVGALKSLITAPKHPIEFKGVDPIYVDNHVRLFTTGNPDWMVPAGFRERRWAIFDVGTARMQDHNYFAAIDHEMDHGGREALLHYLLNFELSQVNLRVIPTTEALRDQQIASMDHEEAWLLDLLMNGQLPILEKAGDSGAVVCSKQVVYRSYVRHAQLTGTLHRSIEIKISTFLKKQIGVNGDYRRRVNNDDANGTRCFKFLSLKECRERFSKSVGQEFNWHEGDDVPEEFRAEEEWQEGGREWVRDGHTPF